MFNIVKLWKRERSDALLKGFGRRLSRELHVKIRHTITDRDLAQLGFKSSSNGRFLLRRCHSK